MSLLCFTVQALALSLSSPTVKSSPDPFYPCELTNDIETYDGSILPSTLAGTTVTCPEYDYTKVDKDGYTYYIGYFPPIEHAFLTNYTFTDTYFFDPYIEPDPSCEYIVQNSLFAKTQCQMPAHCGLGQMLTLNHSMFGDTVLCIGLQSEIPSENPPILHRQGVKMYRLINFQLTPPHPYDIQAHYGVAHDGVDFWLIPQIVLQQAVVYEPVSRQPIIRFNTTNICFMRMDYQELISMYRKIKLGPSLTAIIDYRGYRISYSTISYYSPLPIYNQFTDDQNQQLVTPLDMEHRIIPFTRFSKFCLSNGRHFPTLPYECGPPQHITCLPLRRFVASLLPSFIDIAQMMWSAIYWLFIRNLSNAIIWLLHHWVIHITIELVTTFCFVYLCSLNFYRSIAYALLLHVAAHIVAIFPGND